MKKSITTIWLDYDFSILKTLALSFVFFGLIPNLLLTIQIVQIRKEDISAPLMSIIYMYLMFSWSWIGPYGIWLYEVKIRPKFWREVSELFENENEIVELKNRYDKGMLRRYWWFILAWSGVAIYAFFSVSKFMETFGLIGIDDYLFWVWLSHIGLLGFVSGHGFSGVFDTIRIIKSISEKNIKIDQYHHDGHGGTLCIGTLTIWTLVLFSTGSVFLPILFTALNYQNQINSSIAVLTLIFVFCSAIVGVFMYPLFLMHYRTMDVKRRMHNEIKAHRTDRLNPTCINGSCDLTDQLKILNFRNICVDLDRVASFPVNTRLVAEIILFAFLPFILVFLQKLLS